MNCAGLFSPTPCALCEALLKPGRLRQKYSFKANCICRAGLSVEPIVPPDPLSTLVEGEEKVG